MVPDDASLCVPNRLGAHLSARRDLDLCVVFLKERDSVMGASDAFEGESELHERLRIESGSLGFQKAHGFDEIA